MYEEIPTHEEGGPFAFLAMELNMDEDARSHIINRHITRFQWIAICRIIGAIEMCKHDDFGATTEEYYKQKEL